MEIGCKVESYAGKLYFMLLAWNPKLPFYLMAVTTKSWEAINEQQQQQQNYAEPEDLYIKIQLYTIWSRLRQ